MSRDMDSREMQHLLTRRLGYPLHGQRLATFIPIRIRHGKILLVARFTLPGKLYQSYACTSNRRQVNVSVLKIDFVHVLSLFYHPPTRELCLLCETLPLLRDVVMMAVCHTRSEKQRCTAHPVRKWKTMLESKTFKRAYLIGSVIVWGSILIGTAVLLSGTPYFAQMLLILSGGAFWYILCMPAAFFWRRQRLDQPLPTK